MEDLKKDQRRGEQQTIERGKARYINKHRLKKSMHIN